MSNRLLTLGLVVLAAGSGLALAQPRGGPDRDLDTYSDERLAADLFAELDDIPEFKKAPDEEYQITELRGDIMDALSDQDDQDDPAEQDIDRADLDAEMSEAGTTLEEVVDEALVRADELALQQARPSWRILPATFAMKAPGRAHQVGFRVMAQDRDLNGSTTARVAIREVERGVIAAVRRAPTKRGG